MERLVKDITDITRGNEAEMVFSFPVLQPIVSARLVAKLEITDADGAAVINKLVTTTPTADGQITAAGVPGSVLASVTFKLTKAQTIALTAEIDYLYDVEVFDAGGAASTPMGGKLRLAERIRTAIG